MTINDITMTSEAVRAAQEFVRENADYAGQSLRVYLSGKGCDGFEYGVSFDHPIDGDHSFAVTNDVTVICDSRSFEFLQGSEIEWVDDERGRGFLVQNPHHKKYRGKFYKKSIWKERLTANDAPQG